MEQVPNPALLEPEVELTTETKKTTLKTKYPQLPNVSPGIIKEEHT